MNEHDALLALAGNYKAMHIIDLQKNSIEAVKTRPDIEALVGDGNDAQKVLYSLVENYAAEENKDEYKAIADLEKLTERLRIERAVAYEYKDQQGEWRRGCFTRMNDQGEPEKVLYTVEDIDQQARLRIDRQQELERKDLKTGLLLQMINYGSWTMVFSQDKEPLKMTWDEDIRRQIGWTEEELPASFENWSKMLHPDDVEASWQILRAFIEDETEEYDCTFRYNTKYNGYRWYRCKARYEFTDQQGDLHYIGTFVDITDERAREAVQKLREQEEKRLAAVYDMTGAARWQWTISENGNIEELKWDDKLKQLFGYANGEGAELTLEAWTESIASEDRDRILLATYFLNRTDEKNFDQEYRMITRSGEVRWVRAIARKLEGQNGEPTEVIGTTVDITNQKKAEWQTRVIDTLSNEYGSVFEVNMKDETLNRVKVSGRLKDIDDDDLLDPSYAVRCEAFIRLAVAPEYHDLVGQTIDLSYIREQFKKTDAYSIYYINQLGQYCELKIAKLDDERMVMGIAEKDEEVRHYKAEEEKQRRSREVISGFASEYRSAFYVDLRTEEITAYNQESEADMALTAAKDHEATFSERYPKLVKGFVYETSQETMKKAGQIDNIRKALANKKSFSTIFRTSRDEIHSFYEMKVVKLNDIDEEATEVVIGFMKKDKEVLQTMLVEQLKHDYLAAYYIDLEKDTSRAFEINSDETKLLSGSDRYSTEVTSFAKLLMPEYRETFLKIAEPAALKAALAESDREQIIYRFDGQPEEWFKTSLQVLNRQDGEANSVLMVASRVDDSEARVYALNEQILKQQKELEIALEKAEAANEAKSSFLFNMSHDIRTPLNAIIGFTELAGTHKEDPDLVETYRQKVHAASTQLADILNNVLEMARIENKKIVIEEEKTDLEELFQTTLSVFEVATEKKQQVFKSSCELEHQELYIDKTRYSEILMNILSNAIKYTPEEGQISAEIRELPAEEGTCVLETVVRDNGKGMPPEFIAQIFEEFSREQNSSQSGIQGTGLGMAIVKKLVDLMGGTIEIDSAQGQGTEVRIRIPSHFDMTEPAAEAEAAEEDQQETEASSEQSIDLSGRRVLLAEDIDVNAMLVQEILRMNGVESDRARDGAECVEMLEDAEDGQYDLILMDIQMPNMNGYEATQAIRQLEDEEKQNIPIIALSANAFKEDVEKVLEAGMDDHLAKPIDVDALLHTLAEYCQTA